MKRVYLYLQDGQYSCYADVSDEVLLPPYSTLTAPPIDMDNPYWVNGQWINREKAVAKVQNYETILAVLPTNQQRLAMQQAQQIMLLQSTVMQQNQTNAKLRTANQQQATQIKQLQQMFMLANQQQAIEKSKEVNA